MWLFSFYHQFLICGFTQSLLLSDAGSILATATNWDELEIQEETESGSSVTSKIRLPTQVSVSYLTGVWAAEGTNCSRGAGWLEKALSMCAF